MLNEGEVAGLIATWKEWLEAQPVADLVPKGRVVEAIRRLSEEKVAAEDVAPRLEKAFDAVLARLRAADRTAADLLGPKATERIVEAFGDLEPDERAVRALFEERAVADLLGSVLYDGISEFMKKANQITDMLPGVSTAKKLAGGLFGAIGGGFAGSVREEVERKVEQQVRAFLAGFGKIAVERAIRFATSPANRKMFREMRMNLARKVLATPLRKALERLTPEKAAELRRGLVDAALRAASDERASRAGEGRVEKLAASLGADTLAVLARRVMGGVLPTEATAKLLAPGLARFLATEAARESIQRIYRAADQKE